MSFGQFGLVVVALALILLPQILAIHTHGSEGAEYEEYDYR